MRSQARAAKLLTTEEAARVLSIRASRLKDWRRVNRRGGPGFIKLSKHIVRYSIHELKAFISRARVEVIVPDGESAEK